MYVAILVMKESRIRADRQCLLFRKLKIPLQVPAKDFVICHAL